MEHHFQKQKSLLICRLLYENTWVLFAVLVRRKLWLIQQADADIVSYRHSKVAGALLRFGSITWQVYLKNPQQLQCFAWKNTWTTSPWKLDDIQIYTWIKTGDFSVCVPLCQRYPNLLRFDDLTVCTPPFAVKVRHFHVSRTSIEKSGSIRYVASTIMQLILAFLCWAVRFESFCLWQPVVSSSHGNRWNLFEERAVPGGYNHQDSHQQVDVWEFHSRWWPLHMQYSEQELYMETQMR